MKKWSSGAAAGIILLLAAPAAAQVQIKPTGYAFAGVGEVQRDFRNDTTVQAGLAGEARLRNGLAGGGEVSFLAPLDALDYGIGVLNANVSYYVANPGRFLPFVTGGYSMGFRTAPENGWNVGAGVEYWRGDVGLRLEIRDQVFQFRNREALHFWGVRMGVTFR